jgi:hypothetical protein
MLSVKRNGTHKEATSIMVKKDGVWKQGVEMLVKTNGAWKKVWQMGEVYITSTSSNRVATTLHFDNVLNVVTLENLVVRAYDGNGNLITAMSFGTHSTGAGSYAIYDDDDVYGEVSIYTYPERNTVDIYIMVDYSTNARKIVVTADTVYFS